MPYPVVAYPLAWREVSLEALLRPPSLQKGGTKMAKRALQVGGMAAIGGLAWNAYKAYQTDKANTPSSVGTENAAAPKQLEKLSMNDFTTALDINTSPNGGLLIIQTMVSAAMADGHIDKDESKRIFAEIARLDLSSDEKAMLIDELIDPKPIQTICAQAHTPQTAVEIYTAALLAVDEQRPEGATYLANLAAQLELPAALVDSIHMRAQSPAETAA